MTTHMSGHVKYGELGWTSKLQRYYLEFETEMSEFNRRSSPYIDVIAFIMRVT